MKTITLLTVIALFGLNFPVSAQITLNQSSYASFNPISNDTVVNTTAASTFPNLTSATNATWDMSTITDTIVYYFNYRLHPDSSAYQFADSINIPFGGSFANQVHADCSFISSGLLEYGDFFHYIATPIGQYTKNTADTIWTAKQTELYSSPDTIIKFPATYKTAWSAVYQQNESHTGSIAAFGWVKAPFEIKHFYSKHDSVKGWGSLRVQTLSGSPSSYFDVLQVQVTYSRIDSFFMNGAPIPALELSAFGFTQGEIVNAYYQNYYRAEEITPLAQVNYANASFSKPTSATTNVQNLYTGIENITNNINMAVYPNPSKGIYNFQIVNNYQLMANNQIDIYNVLGEKVYSLTPTTLAGGLRQGAYQIDLSGQPSGLYLYRFMAEDGSLIGEGKIILQK